MKQNINYISHLNNVNHKLYDTEVNSSHIALYNALFQLWNNCGFEDELSINRNDVMKLSKIGSVNTYLKCLKELDKLEFIKYKPSKNPLKGSVINMFRFDTSNDIVVNKFSTSYDTSNDISTSTSSDTLSKLSNQLNNKTIKLLNNNISTINLNLEDFNLNLENFFFEHSNNNNQENFEKEKSSAKKEKFDFRLKLLQYGFEEELVDDWLEVRKNKKATNSETAFNSFINEMESKNCDINKMLQIAVTNSWSGFKHQWVDNVKNTTQNQNPNDHRINAVNAVSAMFGKKPQGMHHNR